MVSANAPGNAPDPCGTAESVSEKRQFSDPDSGAIRTRPAPSPRPARRAHALRTPWYFVRLSDGSLAAPWRRFMWTGPRRTPDTSLGCNPHPVADQSVLASIVDVTNSSIGPAGAATALGAVSATNLQSPAKRALPFCCGWTDTLVEAIRRGLPGLQAIDEYQGAGRRRRRVIE